MKKLILLFLFCSYFINAQDYKIIKIINTNLFELENNQQVTLYGLNIPSLDDTNRSMAELASKIYEWEKKVLLDRKFIFEFKDQDKDNVAKVIIYRTSLFLKENVAKLFLSKGFATLSLNREEPEYNDLIIDARRALSAKVGIWKVVSKEYIVEQKLSLPQLKYERPYFPLLALSVASYVLAWDNFSSITDLQNGIDQINGQISYYRKIPDYEEVIRILENARGKLERQKTRKAIVALTCLSAGIVTTVFSIKKVEVKTDLQSIKLSYRF